ncbi:MAG: hypothetical protein ACLFTV_19290, partial [Desulfococcaceae bacterium]
TGAWSPAKSPFAPRPGFFVDKEAPGTPKGTEGEGQCRSFWRKMVGANRIRPWSIWHECPFEIPK